MSERIDTNEIESRFCLRSCVVSWSLRFDEPIVLPDGAKLKTLREAIAQLAESGGCSKGLKSFRTSALIGPPLNGLRVKHDEDKRRV